MEAHSLYELNEYVRRVIALNFREPVWIKAEASQIKQSRNNFYIDLVEKKEGKDEIIAQANAVIWARNYFFLKKKIGDLLDSILVDGAEILIKVRIDFSERYGLKLLIEDIDPSYTLGQAELRRQEIVDRLKAEGLDTKNAQIQLSPVLQKIAVLSSEKAAGYQDFVTQLETNTYGYHFDITLYPIVVQGNQVERELINALEQIHTDDNSFDCIVIVRGGGSKLDLSWFDTYEIGAAIANAELPVLTGIGHEIDYSVADMVAHTHLKTPTAVADYLIENNVLYESQMIDISKKIAVYAMERIYREKRALDGITQGIHAICTQRINYAFHDLEVAEKSLFQLVQNRLDMERRDLSAKELLVEAMNPMGVLKRGFALVYKNGKAITSQKVIKKGENFEVELYDGKIESQRIK